MEHHARDVITACNELMHNSDESTVCEEGRSVTWFLYLPGRKSPHVYVVICLIAAVFYAFPAYFFCIITLTDEYHVITERWQPHIAQTSVTNYLLRL